MSVAAALDCWEHTDISFIARGRERDSWGNIATIDADPVVLPAVIVPTDLKKLELDPKSSVGKDFIDIYFKGQIEAEINDRLEINGKIYTVKEFRFRPNGGFTKILAKRLTRREQEGVNS